LKDISAIRIAAAEQGATKEESSMAIRVVMSGATGWVGRAMIPSIAAQSDMKLAGAVARNAATQAGRPLR